MRVFRKFPFLFLLIDCFMNIRIFFLFLFSNTKEAAALNLGSNHYVLFLKVDVNHDMILCFCDSDSGYKLNILRINIKDL